MKKKLIIFDLDGVLVNSLKNMNLSLSQTANALNIKLNFLEYKKYIGLPFEEIMKNIGIKKNIKEIKKNYIYYSKNNINKVNISKRNILHLKKLKKDFYLTVFTSKDKLRTNKILKKHKLFDYIVSSEDLSKGKPNPEGIYKIIEKLKVKKKNTIYIGDSFYDFICAKKAKIKYYHATWGYDKMENVKNLNIIKNFKEIQNFF